MSTLYFLLKIVERAIKSLKISIKTKTYTTNIRKTI